MPQLVSDIHSVAVPTRAIDRCGLARIDFADAYHGQIEMHGTTALQAAKAIFGQPPRFARVLMAVRDRAVALVGLKTSGRFGHEQPGGRHIGSFPLLSETAQEVILGGDDRHLDFRIWVGVDEAGGSSMVTVSTLVQRHNAFGRGYLFVVMPFHRLLSRAMLRRGLQQLALTRRPGGTASDSQL